MSENPYAIEIRSTDDFIREMKVRGFSQSQIGQLVIGVRKWAKSDRANHDYAYPSLFVSRLQTVYWRTFDKDQATIMEWYG